MDFTIVFATSQGPFMKVVKRLSILFDDEDEADFKRRVELCKERRGENLAIRRYTTYVLSQSDAIFAAIQQTALHGIVAKLMRTSHDLIVSRQSSVEALVNTSPVFIFFFSFLSLSRITHSSNLNKRTLSFNPLHFPFTLP